MSLSCIILLHRIDCVPSCLPVVVPLGRRMFWRWDRWHRWRTILSSEVPGKQNPLVHSDTIPLSCSALFYCIRTTMVQLLHAAVIEPLSFAWPAIATVNRWNPLAWVGVIWALMCLLIHACLSCLQLLRVESGLIHRGWIRGVWTCPAVCELSVWTRFGKGSGERPCRSTWWVVSL